MLCKAPSQLSQTEGTYILCVGTADRLKPSIDPCCDNHKDRNGQWSFLHEHSASPCPSLTAAFSLTLFLTFISVPTPVTSCHSSTMFLSDQLANYSSSLVKRFEEGQKHWFPTLISSLNLGSSFELGSIMVRSSFSSVQEGKASWDPPQMCTAETATTAQHQGACQLTDTAHPLSQGMSSDPSVRQL